MYKIIKYKNGYYPIIVTFQLFNIPIFWSYLKYDSITKSIIKCSKKDVMYKYNKIYYGLQFYKNKIRCLRIIINHKNNV